MRFRWVSLDRFSPFIRASQKDKGWRRLIGDASRGLTTTYNVRLTCVLICFAYADARRSVIVTLYMLVLAGGSEFAFKPPMNDSFG